MRIEGGAKLLANARRDGPAYPQSPYGREIPILYFYRHHMVTLRAIAKTASAIAGLGHCQPAIREVPPAGRGSGGALSRNPHLGLEVRGVCCDNPSVARLSAVPSALQSDEEVRLVSR